MPARVATPDDLEGVTDTLAAAFRDDPLWTWAFPDPSKMKVWWRFFMRSALRYPGIWIAGDYAAVAVWIPPDGVELTEEEDERVGPLLEELVGDRAPAVMTLLERFDASHPREQPHHYLSMLGTHPDHRGHGIGMGLLAETLGGIDEQHMPASRAAARGRGADALLDTFDRYNRGLADAAALRQFVEQERDAGLRIITSGGGRVQPRIVERITGLIEDEVRAGTYDPPVEPSTLAARGGMPMKRGVGLVLCILLAAVVIAGCGGKTKTVTVPASTTSTATPSNAQETIERPRASTGPLAPTQYKPAAPWCPTSRTCLSFVNWTTYTDTRAEGVGPGKECGGGGTGCRAYEDINVTLTQPRVACGKLRFTRLRMFENDFALDSVCTTYQPA